MAGAQPRQAVAVKVVINTCYGGFSLSSKATEAFLARKGQECHWFRLLPAKGTLVPQPAGNDDLFSSSFTDAEGTNSFYSGDIVRDDPDLVAVVEEMGVEANGRHAQLKVVEIPDGVTWHIEEYDGREWVSEAHQTWR